MDSVMPPTPEPVPRPEDWNEAFTRLADFFRAHRVPQSWQIVQILQEAAAQRAAQPGENLTTIAVRIAQRRIDGWLQVIMTLREIPPARRASLGLVAFHVCEGPRRFASAFLQPDPLPAELVEKMRQFSMQAGPDLQVSNMVPRPIELGMIPAAADNAWDAFEKFPFLRSIVLGILFVGTMLLLFLTAE